MSFEAGGSFRLDPSGPAVLDLPDQPVGLRVKNTDVSQEILVRVAPVPDITAKAMSLVRTAKGTVPARFEFETYSPLNIQELRFEAPWLRVTDQMPLDVAPGVSGISVVVDAQQAPPIPEEGTVPWFIRVSGLSQPLTGSVPFAFCSAPELTIEEGRNRAIHIELPNGEADIVWNIRNRSAGTTLLVRSISIVPATDTSDSKEFCWTITPSRFSVPPGHQSTVNVNVRVKTRVPINTYWFRILIDSNEPTTEIWSLSAEVTARIHDRFVGIDMGTVTSMVAAYDDNRTKMVNVPLEVGISDLKLYSHIYITDYHVDQIPPFDWAIGQKASALGEADPLHLVRDAKLKLGHQHEIPLRFEDKQVSCSVSAEEVVRITFVELIRRTKSALRSRPTKFALGVPTRFSLLQKSAIKDAFVKAAQSLSIPVESTGVQVFDESLAAGVYSLRNTAITTPSRTFTLMVLDFGGGHHGRFDLSHNPWAYCWETTQY